MVPARVRLQGACAVDLVLTTRCRRPWLDRAGLARLVLEGALEEPGTAAVSVLPDRVRPAGLSSLVDEEGRMLQCALRSAHEEIAVGGTGGLEHPQRRDRGACCAGG